MIRSQFDFESKIKSRWLDDQLTKPTGQTIEG
jgi:hypothetical protein